MAKKPCAQLTEHASISPMPSGYPPLPGIPGARDPPSLISYGAYFEDYPPGLLGITTTIIAAAPLHCVLPQPGTCSGHHGHGRSDAHPSALRWQSPLCPKMDPTVKVQIPGQRSCGTLRGRFLSCLAWLGTDLHPRATCPVVLSAHTVPGSVDVEMRTAGLSLGGPHVNHHILIYLGIAPSTLMHLAPKSCSKKTR